jgi:hypothetical protein
VIYIEYYSRRPGVSLQAFHAAVRLGMEGWSGDYAEDRLLLNVGRTWRLGPEPEYFAVWHSPGAGFERLDAWDRIFQSGEPDRYELVFQQAARIDVGGCYEPLVEPLPARGGPYYVEFFRACEDLTAVRAFFEMRVRRHGALTLNLLLYRIGRLGPEPGGLAVWTLPRFAALAEIVGDGSDRAGPIELVAAGTYADVGKEVL